MGNMHFGVYEKTAGAEVVAVADVDESKLQAGKSSLAINIGEGGATIDPEKQKLYGNAADLIQDPAVDLVDICLPTYLHAEHCIKAIEAGKHVLCEKPMAFTYSECEQVIGALQEHKDVKLMIAQCLRFWPAYVYLKEAVESGRLGRLRTGSFWRGANIPEWSWQGWLKDAKRSGGGIMDMHVHDLDFVHYLLGRPRALCATGAVGFSGGYDAVDCVFMYEDRVSVQAGVHMGLPTAFGFEMKYLVAFEKGCLVLDSSREAALMEITDSGKTHPELKQTDGYHEEIAYYVRCIENNEMPAVVTPQSSAFSVKLVEAERQSIETGQVVEL